MVLRAALCWSVLLSGFAANAVLAQEGSPALRYDPPANFYRSASTNPEQYFSNEVNASLQVYGFRLFTGDIQQMFQRSLLREWIDPQNQEANLAAAPLFGRDSIPGARQVLTARFIENVAGLPREHLRIVIVAGSSAAVLDATANSAVSWQRAGPAIGATFASLRVVSGGASPPVAEVPEPIGRALAGMYLGSKPRYKVNLNRPVGYGDWVPSLHYYLFSPDGRVYRSYDPPSDPGGDLRRFDYGNAERDDPDNSGRYSVQGKQLIIQMGGQQPETIATTLPAGNRLVINSVVYLRQ